MSAKVSSFKSVRMNDYEYVFIIAGWNDYVTPITEELQRQFEAFGEDLGQKGLVIKPYKSAARNTIEEVTSKDWDEEIMKRFERETYPFMIVIDKDFEVFDPLSHKWSIIWFSEFENQTNKIIDLFKKLANRSRRGKDIFSYLECVTKESRLKNLAKYFEIKPKVFGISINAQAILEDIKC